MAEVRAAARPSLRARWSSPSRRQLALVGAVAVALLLLYNVWWLLRFRDGYPFDIDEAGYAAIALNNLSGLRHGGLDGLWEAVRAQQTQAPLTSLVAVGPLLVHRALLSLFAVELMALTVTTVATYGLARRFVTVGWAAVAALAVATMPGVLNYTREFSFALPCAATTTVALWALVRSERMTRLPWALLLGVAGGLALLSRTMMLGFVPGLIAAAALAAATAPRELRLRAVGSLVLATLVGFLVALTWYGRNMPYVLDYLRGYGYGESADAYGSRYPLLSVDWWITDLRTIALQELFVPLLAVLLALSLAALVAAVSSLRRDGAAAFATRLLRWRGAPLIVFVVAGYLALATTANTGTAFALPLLPAALVLAVAGAARLRWARLRTALAAGLVAVSLFQLVSFAQIGLFDGERMADLPLLQVVPVTNPRAPAVGAIGAHPETMRFGPADRGWLETADALQHAVRQQAASAGRLPVLAFGPRDRSLNTNVFALAARLYADAAIPIAQLDQSLGDTVSVYREKWLTDPARGQPNVLVTSDAERNDFEPTPTQSKVVAAARSLGFRPFATLRQPNGERLTLWWLPRGPAIPAPPSP